MDPDEFEFLGEKELICIIPTFSAETIHLISGDFGPFRATLPVRVPLWVAMSLKKQHQCKIQAPDWMDVERLEAIKEDEKIMRNFTKMPNKHYMEVAKLLLGIAADDIPRGDEIRTIIKDIWDIRMAKLRSAVDSMVRNDAAFAIIDNLTVLELSTIKPILPHALDQLYRIKTQRRIGVGSQSGTSFFSSNTNPITDAS